MAPRLRRAKGVVHITTRVTNEGGKVRSEYLPFRTNASTLPITPKRSSWRDRLSTRVRNGRYPERTFLPSLVTLFMQKNHTLHAPQSWCHLSTTKATKPSNSDANKPLLLKAVSHK
ncbi:hypothetical protein TNCV_1518691 [Trichonephila clavipes]|nr:hypothetical protein TNCV_1518691 [Trichonephila clavipes]